MKASSGSGLWPTRAKRLKGGSFTGKPLQGPGIIGNTPAMSDTLRQAVEALTPDIVAWRRDFHRHPELGFEEVRTSGIVAERLKALGLDAVRAGVGRTGVVGVLKAARPEGEPVLLRADMDALPVQEESGREYGSTVP